MPAEAARRIFLSNCKHGQSMRHRARTETPPVVGSACMNGTRPPPPLHTTDEKPRFPAAHGARGTTAGHRPPWSAPKKRTAHPPATPPPHPPPPHHLPPP